MDLASNWAALLESEGLGLIEPEQSYQGVGSARRPTGKWSRLEAELNGITNPREFMCFRSSSPETVRATETHTAMPSTGEPQQWGETWEALQMDLTATSKEAELADRARKYVNGLNKIGNPAGLRVKRTPGMSKAEWRRLSHERILDDVAKGTGPVASWLIPPVAPHATRDAGNGPLSIKEPIVGPREIEGSRDGDVSDYPTKVVDTHTYLPGRSPFQMSRFASSNSDITG
jgi:hypothetical protein